MTVAYPGPAAALARYDEVIARLPGLERQGAKMPYTSRNGHMFSFLDPTGTIFLRLSPERYDEFAARYKAAAPVVQHGRTMKGYVKIPATLSADPDALGGWFRDAYDWIGTLKPKPTTRSTKKKASP